jgi:hypothetical protein
MFHRGTRSTARSTPRGTEGITTPLDFCYHLKPTKGHKQMTNEKSYELARDIQETWRDLVWDDCETDARELDRKLAADVNVSNEERARLVCDCFCDYAESLELPGAFHTFLKRFPNHGELV